MKKKLGLDVHGVLSKPELMIPFLEKWKDVYEGFYVISGRPVVEIKEELKDLGYNLTMFLGIYSIIDYLKENNKGGKIWVNEKGWWCEDEEQWWKTKSEICELYEIDILLDDTLKYEQGYLKGKLADANLFFNGGYQLDWFWLYACTKYRKYYPQKLIYKDLIPICPLEFPDGLVFYIE